MTPYPDDSITTGQDQKALLSALQEGRLDIIATDHAASHTCEEKASSGYLEAPACYSWPAPAEVQMIFSKN